MGEGARVPSTAAEEQRRTTVVYLIEKVAHCHAQQKAKASGVPASLPRGRSNVAAKEPLSPVSSPSPPSSSFFFPFPSPSLSCSPSIPSPPPSSAFLCFSLRLDPPPTLLPFPTWHVVSFIRKEEKGWGAFKGGDPENSPGNSRVPPERGDRQMASSSATSCKRPGGRKMKGSRGRRKAINALPANRPCPVVGTYNARGLPCTCVGGEDILRKPHSWPGETTGKKRNLLFRAHRRCCE